MRGTKIGIIYETTVKNDTKFRIDMELLRFFRNFAAVNNTFRNLYKYH